VSAGACKNTSVDRPSIHTYIHEPYKEISVTLFFIVSIVTKLIFIKTLSSQ